MGYVGYKKNTGGPGNRYEKTDYLAISEEDVNDLAIDK